MYICSILLCKWKRRFGPTVHVGLCHNILLNPVLIYSSCIVNFFCVMSMYSKKYKTCFFSACLSAKTVTSNEKKHTDAALLCKALSVRFLFCRLSINVLPTLKNSLLQAEYFIGQIKEYSWNLGLF